jgi:beta-lactamase regulating signal transducer with metallopeptidase domain
LLNWLWQGSVVALATGVSLRLLTRARAQSRYLLCWIVLGVVLTLPVLPLILAIDASPQEPIAGPAPGSGVVLAVPSAWWTSTTIVLSMWAAWSGLHGIRIARAVLALRTARRRCRPFPATEESRLAHWNDVRGLGRRTKLVLSEDVRAAAILGCGSPVIAVAPALIGHLDRDELDGVVIHEWAHVQRRDDLLNLAQLAVRAVAGWHPAVWWLNRQLQIERESACDEAAIALTGSAKDYAVSLAKAASVLPATRRMVPAVGALSSPGLRSRVTRILSYRRLVSRAWSASTAITAAFTLVVMALCVAGFRLIGMAVIAAPLEPRQSVAAAPVDRIQAAPASSIRRPSSPDRRSRPPLRGSPVPDRIAGAREAASDGPPAVVTLSPAGATAEALPTPPPVRPDLAVSFEAVPIARGVTLGAEPPGGRAPEKGAATPWDAAADTGVAVGRASQRAAVATAGFFSRLGKKIAGSF